MKSPEIEGKLKYILIEISKTKTHESLLVELLEHSTFEFEEHWNHSTFPNAYNIFLTVTPDVFIKSHTLIKTYEDIIKTRINNTSKLAIGNVKILPDYSKLQIINSKVFSIVTDWEEINQLQNKLIASLQTSQESIDFQGIGLISRTIMDKLARQVFDPAKHKPKDAKISVQQGNFKNQLHTYIDGILSGESNREFRKLAKSAIDFVEDSIDFMNKTTHKLDAEKHLAEVCVISTINAISIVRLIKQLE